MASLSTQDVHGVIGVHAVRPTAVGDVFLVFRQLPEATLQVINGDGDRASNMTGDVLTGRPSIENDDMFRTCTFQEFVHRDGLGALGTIAEMLAHEPFEVREPTFGDRSNHSGQLEHVRIDKAVMHE